MLYPHLSTHHSNNWSSWHLFRAHQAIIIVIMVAYTCNELMAVKDTAKLSLFLFTANIPKIKVNPSRGRRMTDAFTRAL